MTTAMIAVIFCKYYSYAEFISNGIIYTNILSLIFTIVYKAWLFIGRKQ